MPDGIDPPGVVAELHCAVHRADDDDQRARLQECVRIRGRHCRGHDLVAWFLRRSAMSVMVVVDGAE
jgi:hypothetical protein